MTPALPWHLWRDEILRFAPYDRSRLVCRDFERHTRTQLAWRVPERLYHETERQRVHCVSRLLQKNPGYACVGGENCESFLFHYVCTQLERYDTETANGVHTLVIVHSADIIRLVSLVMRFTSLRNLAWMSIDEDDEIPWETIRSVLRGLRNFTSPVVDPIRFMESLVTLTVVGDRFVDEPSIHELRTLERNLPNNNHLETILFGNENDEIDMRNDLKSGRIISRIINKCSSLTYIRVSGIAVAIDSFRRVPATNRRKAPLRLDVVTRVRMTLV